MRLDASNAWVDSDMGLTSPIPPSLDKNGNFFDATVYVTVST